MWDQVQHFHFLRPYLLLLVVPLIMLIFLVKNHRTRSGLWGRVCDERLLPYLLIGQTKTGSKRSFISLGLAGLAIILAFSGPTWEKLPQPVFRTQAAMIIALDLSRSMDVTDVKPSRLARARHKILDILEKRQEGQTALIVYAAESFVVTPLTEDSKTVAALVKSLSTDLMPFQGSYPEKAIQKSIELFKQASAVNGHVLLVTDGIESQGVNDAAAQLVEAGYRLSILGIGTEDGAPIADYRGGFVKGPDGSIVIARLDESRLKAAASGGSGIYQSMTANDQDINRLIDVVNNSRQQQELSEEPNKLKLKSDQWREEGPWILLLMLPIIALVFRRGYLVILVAILLPVPQTSYAFDWASLWQNQNQRAKSAMESGDNKQAAELFENPEWRAAASYRAEDYQKTIEELESANSPDAYYNKGNAYAKLGDLQQAIQSYDQALKLNPDHEDAKHNRELVQEYLEKNQENQEQQQDQNQSDNSEQNKDDKNKDSENNQSNNEQSEEDQQQSQQQNQQSKQDDSQQDDSQQQEQASKENQENEQQAKEKQAQEKPEEQSDKEAEQHQLAESQLTDEEKAKLQKTEQWLRRIPDDPGGLLRRKFRYQSELDSRSAKGEAKPW